MDHLQAMSPVKRFFDVPIKFGILIGILSVLIQHVSYSFLMPKNFVTWVGGMIIVFIMIVALIILTTIQQRRQMGGYISFKDAFSAAFIAIVISSIIATVWAIIYVKFLYPNIADTFKSSMLDFMERNHAPQAKLDEEASKDISKFNIGIGTRLLNLGTFIICKSVVGLIAAAFVKKEPKVQML